MASHAPPIRASESKARNRARATPVPAPRPPWLGFAAQPAAVHGTLRRAPIQRLGGSGAPPTPPARPNRTGLPDHLKEGLEAQSGLSMDDVRVHRGSPEPAKLGALAYAKGSDIHLGPGQESHLPHEAWHVVQQKQGRVRATSRLNAVVLNDDGALEAEATRMGDRALQSAGPCGASFTPPRAAGVGAIVQRTTVAIEYYEGDKIFEAYLEKTPAPFPLHFFTGQGAHVKTFNTKDEVAKDEVYSLLAANLNDQKDQTQLHIVSHGSPGRLASVDLDQFLPELLKLGVLGSGLKEIRLSACYAMMRREIDDKSVALRIAEWAQGNLGPEMAGAVALVTGYTASSSGLYASGQPSYEAFDPRARLEAQPIESYLFHAVKAGITARRNAGENIPSIKVGALKTNAQFGAADLIDQLLAMAAQSSSSLRERTPAKRFNITSATIEGEEELRTGHVVASVEESNWNGFPAKLLEMEHLPASALEAIAKAVAATIEATIEDAAGTEK